jgi:flagellar assembly protein FliH
MPPPKTIQLPVPLRDVRVRRVLSCAAAREAETEERVRAAYERGRHEGEQALSEFLVQQRQETRQLFEGVLQSLRDAVPQLVRDVEPALVLLALEVARKLVADLPLSAEMVESAVREALTQIEPDAEVTILLHHEDLELLGRLNSTLLNPATGGQQPRFQAAAEVTRGGCLVRTRFGTVDARRETKFDLLKRELLS